MTQDTQSKMAAILAAAQAKAATKTVVNFMPPRSPEPEPIKPMQELSNYTVEDILTGYEPAEDNEPSEILAPVQPEQPKNSLKIVDYSDRAFAIITETKPEETILNILRQYGNYNSRLKCGKGWIFSKRHLNAVKTALSL